MNADVLLIGIPLIMLIYLIHMSRIAWKDWIAADLFVNAYFQTNR